MVGTLGSDNCAHQCFTALQPLAEKRPQDVVPHDDKIMDAIQRMGQMGVHGANILVHLAKISDVSVWDRFHCFCYYSGISETGHRFESTVSGCFTVL